MPEWVWGRLATIAEHRHCTTEDLIAEGVMAVLGADKGRLGELEMELRKQRAEKKLAEMNGVAA